MGTAQEKYLRTERFWQNQALLQLCTTVDGAIKNIVIMTVQQVLLSPIMDQLIVFGQVTSLDILQHLLRLYGEVVEINLK